ncbi:MAG: hypothetical protein LPK80_06165 [Bacteroidota bacterium]|nr:hypothetical protein [Bacteroidota bacterium]MDX5427976.1 hypothetical protein [Bacteroidota bacterium]MDX5448968.1 hypothetical protein [Bacteroidota bacterium]MDX5505822.1 hypothetical protein [Bacteroidota bacterium]
MRSSRFSIFFLVLTVALLGCSRKKDTFTSRTYHKMTSKFNPLFNGEQTLLKGMETLENSTQDNYEEILQVYPWGDEKLAQTIASDMERSVEKGSKVIQQHSMYIRGDQKNPYIIDSYMLIGKARFMKYELFPALETFNYVSNQFKDSDAYYEAILWAGRTNTRIGNYYAAENNFNELYNNKKVPKKLEPHVRASMAQLYIETEQYNAAIRALADAVEDAPDKKSRVRWTFIMAQLNEKLGNKHDASVLFGKVADLHPDKYELEFKARIRQAKNFDIYMESPAKIYRILKDLAKDEKNKEYLDQIYYAMAEVAIEEEDFPKAEEYLQKSISSSTNNPTQKGQSFLRLANINYDFESYVKAEAFYDSAITVLPKSYPELDDVRDRKVSLSKLVANIQEIELQDSLLELSAMSPSKQKKIFEEYIEWLKDEEERLRREEEMKTLNKQLAAQSNAQGGGVQAGGAGGFYFYNASLRNKGMAEFNQIWGQRDLADNWRVKSLQGPNAGNMANGGGNNQGQAQEEAEETGQGPAARFQVETYLSRIPDTEEKKNAAHEKIKAALMSNAVIYKEELKNPRRSAATYEDFLKRYPTDEKVPQAYYALYRTFDGLDEKREKEEYKDKLLSEYPESLYAKLVRDPGTVIEDRSADKLAAKAYQICYTAYLEGNMKAARACAENGKVTHANTQLEPKFAMLIAFTYGQEKNESKYTENLQYVVDNYPKSPEAGVALGLLNHLGGPASEAAEKYTFEATKPHQVVALFPAQGINANDVRNEIALLNQREYKLRNFQIKNIFLDKEHQLMIISGFANSTEAQEYLDKVLNEPKMRGALTNPKSRIFLISEDNFRVFYDDKDVKTYVSFYNKYYKS